MFAYAVACLVRVVRWLLALPTTLLLWLHGGRLHWRADGRRLVADGDPPPGALCITLFRDAAGKEHRLFTRGGRLPRPADLADRRAAFDDDVLLACVSTDRGTHPQCTEVLAACGAGLCADTDARPAEVLSLLEAYARLSPGTLEPAVDVLFSDMEARAFRDDEPVVLC